MHQTKCILFDFFGTLVDYENSIETFQEMYFPLNDVLNENEIRKFNEMWLLKYKACVKQANESLVEFSLYQMTQEVASQFRPVPLNKIRNVVDLFMARWQQKVHVRDDTLEVIPRLSNSYKLGIVSNTHYKNIIPSVLANSNLQPFFSVVILSVEVGIRKPCKTIFEKAANSLLAEPEQCYFVGNNYYEDIIGAKTARMRPVLLCKQKPVINARDRYLCVYNLFELERLL